MSESSAHETGSQWHDCSVDAILTELSAMPSGLRAGEALARLKIHGPNRVAEPPRHSTLLRFLLQFHNILIYVLMGSAAITFLLGHLTDTAVILAVVIANAVIGLIQEGKAVRAMEAIRQMLAPRASVMRDGERLTVAGEDLVPGDIVLLESGDKVPADLRLLQAHGVHIQEAILTGESLPVEKNLKPVAASAALGDRSCMAFSGTLITTGQCRGVVVATGPNTEIGRIAGLISGVETLTTPLVKQMDMFARWLSALILVIAAILLAFGYFVGHYAFSDMFMIVVSLSVAAIPEGLPAVLTITLAIGVHAMAQRNAIVRRLTAIETLGSVSVICTDKTGTLTRNEMTVASVVTRHGVLAVSGAGYSPVGTISAPGRELTSEEHLLLAELSRAAALCNDASLREHQGEWTVHGDPMEGALLAFAGKAGMAGREERDTWVGTDVIPFDSKHGFMATLYHDHEGRAYIFAKGAPERIVAMSGGQRADAGGTEPVNESYWNEKATAIAAEGQRVLALAARALPPEHTVLKHTDVDGSLLLLGLVGLVDPPRPEAVAAVGECHSAGIRVKMITGDHAGTAAAIGRLIGLRNPERVLTGIDLDRMSDSALAAAVLKTDVFARTSPEHKLKLVMALQAHGLTVAMTGDGVNDAPALKRADAGIAMGGKGSEAAKEAAELVLADDNFASIVAAVREGRTVYNNIKKVISWTLPTNAGEAMTIVVALVLGMTLPITPVQILWVNLITAITLGVALAFEPAEDNTMRRPPRPRDEPLLNAGLVWHIVLVTVLFACGVFGIYIYAMDRGYTLELARTIALNTLVVMEIFHLFFIRNIYGTSFTWKAIRGTRVVWLAIAIITVAQFAITFVPPLQQIFETEAVPFLDGLLIVGVGIALFVIVEIEKQLRLRLWALRPV